MVLRYLETACLSRGHTSGITALAFSSKGQFLASAGLDGRVCIWRTDDYRLRHVVSHSGEIAVLSLVWIGPNEDRLICGLKDGKIVTVVVSEVSIASVRPSRVHPMSTTVARDRSQWILRTLVSYRMFGRRRTRRLHFGCSWRSSGLEAVFWCVLV